MQSEPNALVVKIGVIVRWLAFAMICASLAAVLALVHEPALQPLSLRVLDGAAALICGISGGVQVERSRSAASRESDAST